MKNYFLSMSFVFLASYVSSQTKDQRFGVTAGAFIQQYNGNLGNSFFKFNSTCFAGGTAGFGMYLNKSFDLDVSAAVSDFGYCQTESDRRRIVSDALRCPGCVGGTGMGELRSRMISGNISIKYKLANGIFLKETSKFVPYFSAGIGLNHLSDNMKRNCVNVGNNISINAGTGIKYNLNKRFSIGYNLGVGCFVSKKVYASNPSVSDDLRHDEDYIKMQKRKDLYMQNTLSVGINLF